MSAKFKILWIDDNEEREREIAGVKPDFCCVKKKNIQECLLKVKETYDQKNKTPDLILLDQVLDKIDKKAQGAEFFTSGASISLMLREFWRRTPIIGVTAADNIRRGKVALSKQYAYDDFIKYEDFSEFEEKLLMIARTFRREVNIERKEDIIGLIKCPPEIRGRLTQILPGQLLQRDDTQLFRLYHWVNSILIRRPGFLYDSLWISTFLGLTSDGFKEVRSIFKSAQYKGIFANTRDERWWPGKVKQILVRTVKRPDLTYAWQLGRFLSGVTKKNFSRCWKCKKEYPEIVAYTDSTKSDREAMHMSCTEALSDIDNLLFFEQLRLMKDE